MEDRVASRSHIPDYRRLLMESAVRVDDDGVVFDIQHPSWKGLVQLVKNQQQMPTAVEPLLQRSATAPAVTNATAATNGKLPSDRHGNDVPVVESVSAIQASPISERLQQELIRPKPRAHWIRQHVQASRDVTSENRADVWIALLGCKGKQAPAELDPDRAGCRLDLYNQRVIRMDVERTRPDVEWFRDGLVRKKLELMLTVYCKRHVMGYKQGLNYLAAPFLLVMGLPRLETAYNCFAQFLGLFLPNTFTDDQFGGLQCIFRMFGLLLQYHDPGVSSR